MVPILLQGIPVGLELLIVLGIAVVVFLIGLAATYWMYSDAKKQGNDSAALWGIVTFFGFFLGGLLGFGVVALYAIVGRE